MAWPYYAATTGDAGAAAAFQSASSASGLDVSSLGQLGQLQLAVANLLRSDPTTVAVPAGDVASGTFGSLIPDTGIYSFPSQVGIGTAGVANRALTVGGTITAASARVFGLDIAPTMVAVANNDILYALNIGPARTPGAFTGLTAGGLRVVSFSVAAFTTPADPFGIDIGVITGTGATNAYAVRLAPPTGATNNYLLAHTTAATFNVKSDGSVTSAVGAVFGGNVSVNSLFVANTGNLGSANFGYFAYAADGVWNMLNNAGTGFTRLNFGPATTASAALAVSGTAMTLTRGDGTAGTQTFIIDGTGYGAGVASLRLNGLTTAAVSNQVGTLTNAPVAGNPAFWCPISIAGTIRYLPCW